MIITKEKLAKINDPQDCDTEKSNGHQIVKINIWKAELITSAVWTISETGNMASMLLKIKNK
jgi:hypothetical protein